MDKRLERVLPGLTAKERVVMMLRDFKADKPQDRQLLQSTPDKQTKELNRLVGLMNAANGDLAHIILIIHERVEKEELRFAWLEWARICALEMWGVRAQFNVSGREMITESEYRSREREAGDEPMSIDECATILTEDYHTFDDADYEIDEEGNGSPTDKAWYRARNRHAKRLRALVKDGTLARVSARGVKIASRSFFGWLGEPVPVVPDLGMSFDVRPDDKAPAVERARKDHAFIAKLLDGGSCNLELPLDMESPLVFERGQSRFGIEMARIMAATIRTGVQENWRELRAIEEQVELMTEEFDGEDVLHPRVRAQFDEAKEGLIALHADLQRYTGEFELPDPDEDLRATAQRVVDNEVRHVPVR